MDKHLSDISVTRNRAVGSINISSRTGSLEKDKIAGEMIFEADQATVSGQPLQHAFLESLRSQGTPTVLYLLSGIRLQGRIHAFDQYTVSIADTAAIQVVFKSAISTIVPAAGAPPPPPKQLEPEAAKPEVRASSSTRTVTVIHRKARTGPRTPGR
jgi:host factor-I protein